MSEVAIVGGGMAGLAAARTLVEYGIDVDVFEATERFGGRARTVYEETALLPVELGPEFVHGRPDATLALARAATIELESVSTTRDWSAMWHRFGELLSGAEHLGSDESARAYSERAGLTGEDAQLFARLVEGFYGAPLDDISISSVAGDASGLAANGAVQARLRGGYGRIASWIASRLSRAHVDLHRGCTVTALEWTDDRVRIGYRKDGADALAMASYVIVTLPVSVLADVTYAPGLGDHANALRQFAMGQVVKVVLCMREPAWPPDRAFVQGDGAFPTFWVRSHGSSHQLTAWAGGPHALALAGRPVEELRELAVAGFAAALGMPPADLDEKVRHAHHHDYHADPHARGAYSYTRVGGVGAAKLLARPIDGRVFFAGEATDPANEGTVAGALASGARAARQILHRRAITRRSIPRAARGRVIVGTAAPGACRTRDARSPLVRRRRVCRLSGR